MKLLGSLLVLAALAVFLAKNGQPLREWLDTHAPHSNGEPELASVAAKATAEVSTVAPKIARSETTGPVIASSSARVGAGGTSYTPTFVNLGSDERRKFHLTIEQVVPGGAAVAWGSFYALPPDEETNPERLDYRDARRASCGKIFVTGLPSGLVDKQEWKGWLIRDGAKTYTTVAGAYKTVPSYRVAAEPPPVPPKPGAWMRRNGRTALDR